jgi:hypothetical protein
MGAASVTVSASLPGNLGPAPALPAGDFTRLANVITGQAIPSAQQTPTPSSLVAAHHAKPGPAASSSGHGGAGAHGHAHKVDHKV